MRHIQNRLPTQFFKNIVQQKRQICQSPRNALKEAESLVGFSSCFGRKWLENENIRTIEILTKKYLGDDVSYVENIQKLLMNDYHLPWGLVILLISKTAGPATTKTKSKLEVQNIQRSVAEVGEMLRFMKLLHNDVQTFPEKTEENNFKTFSNNVAILVGDYLLARSFREFGAWKQYEAMELICSGVRDFSDFAVMEPVDCQNRFIPAKPEGQKEDIAMKIPDLSDPKAIINVSEFLGNAKNEWVMRHLLGGASLLSKCCQAALLVADHPKQLQVSAHLLGSNLALASQASTDYFNFLDDDHESSFGLMSAPLMFHLRDDPSYYEKILETTNPAAVNYEQIKSDVRLGNGLNETRELVDELAGNALDVLRDFPDNDAKTALGNIIKELIPVC